ncbi:hypothetical protein AVEN_94713-1 [Araneus ventricosus]|uniref:Uncharacterized protein n=1 Tax=Araneus ventricosus TaxID=182803 RepID=A0A4Y2CQ06_ARAVE|nr:hypothetical protein AVEN_94713-1 [Araneus ventricosus]
MVIDIRLESAYWRVQILPKDREKTAFTTGQELSHVTVAPLGHCNAFATFKRLMETVLRGLMSEGCLMEPEGQIALWNQRLQEYDFKSSIAIGPLTEKQMPSLDDPVKRAANISRMQRKSSELKQTFP